MSILQKLLKPLAAFVEKFRSANKIATPQIEVAIVYNKARGGFAIMFPGGELYGNWGCEADALRAATFYDRLKVIEIESWLKLYAPQDGGFYD